MIAVTIATPGYEQLANEQAFYARKNTGLDVHVIHKADAGYHHKLELQKVFKGHQILFFDADLRLIRHVDWIKIANDSRGSFVTAPDPGIHDPNQFPSTDSKALGIDRLQYFNSGLFIANFKSQQVVDAFDRGRQLMEERLNGMWKDVNDPGDQSFMNAGIQQMGIQVKLLHPRFNFFFHAWRWGCLPEIPRNIIGLHAAGTALNEKKEILDAQHRVFGMTMGAGNLPRVKRWYQRYTDTP